MLERHRHHSVSGAPGDGARYYGAGPQVPKVDEGRGGGQAEDVTNAGDEDRGHDQDEQDPRHDVQARLRRAPDVIVADTWANRSQCSRSATVKFQAGTRTTSKRGRGR